MIWLGANDAALPVRDQHVPLERFKANLSKFVWHVSSPESPRYSPDTRVIFMTPPPVNADQWAARQAAKDPPGPRDREFEVTKTYAEAVKEVGAKEGVAVVDLWTTIYDAAGRVEKELSKFLTDGLHLNEAGYAVGVREVFGRAAEFGVLTAVLQIVFEELNKTIAEKHPEYYHENLQFVFAP